MGSTFWQGERMAGMGFLRHGVTRRGESGVVGLGAFASLNLGLTVGDESERVVENRRRAAEALGFSVDDLVCAAQVHGGGFGGWDGKIGEAGHESRRRQSQEPTP